MAEERLKVARHKLIRPRAAHASSQKSSGNDVDPASQEEESAAVSPDFPSDISVLLIFEDQRLRSFGTQVSYRFFKLFFKSLFLRTWDTILGPGGLPTLQSEGRQIALIIM